MLAAAVLAGVETARGHSYQLSSGIAITVIGVATAAGSRWWRRACGGRAAGRGRRPC